MIAQRENNSQTKREILLEGSYTALPNSLLSLGLSCQAITCYLIILSKPSNWAFRATSLNPKDDTVKVANLSKDQGRKAVAELENSLLVERVVIRAHGRIVRSEYMINTPKKAREAKSLLNASKNKPLSKEADSVDSIEDVLSRVKNKPTKKLSFVKQCDDIVQRWSRYYKSAGCSSSPPQYTKRDKAILKTWLQSEEHTSEEVLDYLMFCIDFWGNIYVDLFANWDKKKYGIPRVPTLTSLLTLRKHILNFKQECILAEAEALQFDFQGQVEKARTFTKVQETAQSNNGSDTFLDEIPEHLR